MKVYFVIAALTAFLCASAAEIHGKVIKVYDGDTITVVDHLDKGKFRIRLAGIDAPEKGCPGDAEATEYLSKQILNKDVIIRYKSIDRYARPLGIVFATDGININDEMLRKGLVKKYKSKK